MTSPNYHDQTSVGESSSVDHYDSYDSNAHSLHQDSTYPMDSTPESYFNPTYTYGNSSDPAVINNSTSSMCKDFYQLPAPWNESVTIPLPTPFNFTVPLLNSSLFQFTIMLFMLMRQLWMKYRAREGSKEAASMLLLGIYKSIFLYIFFITLFAAITNGPNDDLNKKGMAALNWALHHAGYEGITVLLLHPGVGKRALKTALIIAFVWGLITYFCVKRVLEAGYEMDTIMVICSHISGEYRTT